MKSSESLRQHIIGIAENQIKNNKPPETNLTLIRLKKLGYSSDDAKQLIAQCIAVEIYTVMKEKKPFDEKRYFKNLTKLPEKPMDT